MPCEIRDRFTYIQTHLWQKFRCQKWCYGGVSCGGVKEPAGQPRTLLHGGVAVLRHWLEKRWAWYSMLQNIFSLSTSTGKHHRRRTLSWGYVGEEQTRRWRIASKQWRPAKREIELTYRVKISMKEQHWSNWALCYGQIKRRSQGLFPVVTLGHFV